MFSVLDLSFFNIARYDIFNYLLITPIAYFSWGESGIFLILLEISTAYVIFLLRICMNYKGGLLSHLSNAFQLWII